MFSQEENYASMYYDYKHKSKEELRCLQVRVAELQAKVAEELEARDSQDVDMESRPQAGEFLCFLFDPHAYIYVFAGVSLNENMDILARQTLN